MPMHVTVLLPNQPGALCGVADLLGSEDINIWAYHLANAGRTGFVQMLCIPHDRAMRILRGKYKHYVTESEVIVIKLDDEPGQLGAVLRILDAHQLNLTHSYGAFDEFGNGVLVLDIELPAERDIAKELLETHGYTLLEEIGVPNS